MKTHGGFFISQIRHLSGRVFEKILKESGVDTFNGAQGRILYVLWEHEQLSFSELGKLTALAKTTLTSMIDRMEKNGLVTRIPNTKDRRQIFITVSEKGKKQREVYNRVSEQMNALFYKDFNNQEIAFFEDTLKRIINNLESVQ